MNRARLGVLALSHEQPVSREVGGVDEVGAALNGEVPAKPLALSYHADALSRGGRRNIRAQSTAARSNYVASRLAVRVELVGICDNIPSVTGA